MTCAATVSDPFSAVDTSARTVDGPINKPSPGHHLFHSLTTAASARPVVWPMRGLQIKLQLVPEVTVHQTCCAQSSVLFYLEVGENKLQKAEEIRLRCNLSSIPKWSNF